MSKVTLDLWGGNHIFDTENKRYDLDRDCGLFSNVTVQLYGLVKFGLMGHIAESLSMKLIEYETDYDFYPHLFKMGGDEVDYTKFTEYEIGHFMKYCEPNRLGIGRRKQDINFNIINSVLDRYYNLSDECEKMLNDMIEKHDLDFENTTFIWARKTDKISESDIPTADDYFRVLKENNLLDKKIILQTDDVTVLDDFNNLGVNFTTLNELPYSPTNDGFHIRLHRISDFIFRRTFGISKVEYLQRLLCLVKLASRFKNVLIYPGNLTTVIPIFRGNFNNTYSFVDTINLLPE